MIFLETAPGIPKQGLTMVFYLLFFAIVYFFLLRPPMKKAKAQEAFADSVTKGNEVVTNSGIIGRVNKIEGDVIHLQVDQKTFIRVVKGAISKDLTESFTKKQTETTS